MDTMDMKHIGTGTDNSKLNIIFCQTFPIGLCSALPCFSLGYTNMQIDRHKGAGNSTRIMDYGLVWPAAQITFNQAFSYGEKDNLVPCSLVAYSDHNMLCKMTRMRAQLKFLPEFQHNMNVQIVLPVLRAQNLLLCILICWQP